MQRMSRKSKSPHRRSKGKVLIASGVITGLFIYFFVLGGSEETPTITVRERHVDLLHKVPVAQPKKKEASEDSARTTTAIPSDQDANNDGHESFTTSADVVVTALTGTRETTQTWDQDITGLLREDSIGQNSSSLSDDNGQKEFFGDVTSTASNTDGNSEDGGESNGDIGQNDGREILQNKEGNANIENNMKEQNQANVEGDNVNSIRINEQQDGIVAANRVGNKDEDEGTLGRPQNSLDLRVLETPGGDEKKAENTETNGADNTGRSQLIVADGAVVEMQGDAGSDVNNMAAEEDPCHAHPDAIIAGFEGCGVTALKQFLGAHPDVYIYSHSDPTKKGNAADEPIVSERTGNKCTPSNKTRIMQLEPQADPDTVGPIYSGTGVKLIFIVKDPILRMVSYYDEQTEKVSQLDGKINEIILQLMKQDKHTGPQASSLFKYSLYSDRLADWLQYFDVSQIFVVNGDVSLNPAIELTKLESYLKLPAFFSDSQFKLNENTGQYCLLEDSACLQSERTRPYPRLNGDVIAELQMFYKPYTEKFFELIGQRFNW